jgi:hypothetical protein
MADQAENPVNAGEQITNSLTSNMPLNQEAQFRILSQRLESLTTQVSLITKPPTLRLAETLQLVMIAIGLLIALIGAFSLSDRIADVRADQAASEIRIKESVGALEVRLSTKLDKLSDQFSSMDERTARLEGAQESKKHH